MPFENSITGGQGALIRPAIKSPNFVTGVSGWTINRDGSAEFNNVVVRGTIVAGSISAGSIGSSNIVNSNFNGGTINQSVITFDTTGGTLFVYSTATVVTTFNSGSGNFANPAGVTSLQVECWGGGGGAGGADNVDSGAFSYLGGGGGGGGEYAADFAVAVTPSTNYAYSVGAGGTAGNPLGSFPPNDGLGGNGSNTTFTGNSVTVTAHGAFGGFAGGNSGTSNGSGLGGSGSTNSIHFNGGNGGNRLSPITGGDGGCGGGSSGGTSSTGGNGAEATSSTGSAGGTATGAGSGGNGGNSNQDGNAGSGPGGGGGGSGDSGPTGVGGAGANGRVRITYVSSRTLIAAIAPAGGTDPINGTAYPAGISGIEAGVDYVRLGSSGALEYGASGGAVDVNLYRLGGGVLATDHQLRAVASGATSTKLTTVVSGDSTVRHSVTGDGTLNWGSGSAALDTNLFRDSANVLRTNDSLIIDGIGGRLVKFKSSNNTAVNNSTTYTSDSDLFVSVVANATYEFRLFCLFQSNATPGFKIRFTVPTGATMPGTVFQCLQPAVTYGMTGALGEVTGITGTGATSPIDEHGLLVTGANAGTFQFQWSQNTANASNTFTVAGSYLFVNRIG